MMHALINHQDLRVEKSCLGHFRNVYDDDDDDDAYRDFSYSVAA